MTDPRPHIEESWSKVEQALCRSEALAAAGQFAAAIVHEINNPLEAVTNLAYLTKLDADHPDRVRQHIALLEEQLAHVTRIANQTLTFYRSPDTLEAIGAVALAEAALRVHERKIAAKRIHLVKDLRRDAPIRVHAGEMLQVMSNLVSNALDALPEKGTLCLRVRPAAKEVHLIVADDGHGIPKAILNQVFEPFFTTKKERGTGLGLAISKSIVERHSGRIKTWSSVREGRSGTAFRITLPLHESDQAAGTES